MKKIFLIAVGILLVGSLFGQAEKTTVHTKQLIASDIITGKVKVVANSNVTVAFTVDSCLNIIHSNLGASDNVERDLPISVDGLVVGFLTEYADTMVIDPNTNDSIFIDGVWAGAGSSIRSDGNENRYIVLLGRGSGKWVALGEPAGWADNE